MKSNMQFIIIDDEEITLFIHKRIITVALGITDIRTFSCAAAALRFFQNDFTGKPFNLQGSRHGES